MARTPRSKPTSSGPGRGTPRSRTAARPGERTATLRSGTKPLEPAPASALTPPEPPVIPAGNRAVGFTWRLLVVAVVVATIAVSLAQSLRVYFVQADEIAELRAEIQATNQEIAQLQDHIGRWQDPEFVRATARERLGWVMPGEVGYRVIGADGETLGGEGDVLGIEEEFGGLWWQQMWGSVTIADRPVAEEDGTDEDEDVDVFTPAEPSPTPESTR